MLGPQDKQPEVEEKEVKETPDSLEPSVDNEDLEKLAVARSLNVEKLEELKHHSNRLSKIVQWAKAKGAKNQVDIAAEISEAKNELGNPSIYDLAVYVGLEMEKMELDKKINKFKKK